MEKKINFEFQARYETLGELTEKTTDIWLVCHGHGQLAKYFIKKFESLDLSKHYIIAPEGIFRYYLQGFTGRVGATWMTKEDRLNDINNYLRFLTEVYQAEIPRTSKNTRINFLGFSQGAATISRLATQTELHFDRLILWAGIFPPDLPPLESQERLKDKKCVLVYGDSDPYLTQDRIEEQEEIALKIKTTPSTIIFNGVHELNDKVLIDLAKI